MIYVPFRIIGRTVVALFLVGLMGACSSDSNDATPATTNAAAPPTTKAPSDDDAIEAVKRQFDYLDKGQHGRSWDELHPAQQAFIPKALFMRCAVDDVSGIEIDDLEIVESYHEQVTIPGTDVDTDSVAITVKFTAREGQLEEKTTETFHEFYVDGGWRWAVADADAYKAGDCPA